MPGWEELLSECSNCTKCALSKGRSHVVVGRGNPQAPVMLIGEGPGEQEDRQGLPFVGPAGKLLDLLLEAQIFSKEDYYIANIVKCRPPANRVPQDDEAEKCLPYLRRQVQLVKPGIIVCLGATAMKYIVDRNAKITQVRGQWVERKKFWIMPTFHPAALLRDESKKALMWEDFKKVRDKLMQLKEASKVTEEG